MSIICSPCIVIEPIYRSIVPTRWAFIWFDSHWRCRYIQNWIGWLTECSCHHPSRSRKCHTLLSFIKFVWRSFPAVMWVFIIFHNHSWHVFECSLWNAQNQSWSFWTTRWRQTVGCAQALASYWWREAGFSGWDSWWTNLDESIHSGYHYRRWRCEPFNWPGMLVPLYLNLAAANLLLAFACIACQGYSKELEDSHSRRSNR